MPQQQRPAVRPFRVRVCLVFGSSVVRTEQLEFTSSAEPDIRRETFAPHSVRFLRMVKRMYFSIVNFQQTSI